MSKREKPPAGNEVRWKGSVSTTRDRESETITKSFQLDLTYPKRSRVTQQLVDLFVEFLVDRHEHKKANEDEDDS